MKDEVELTDEQLALGGYRYEDLQELRIVENRTDLARKQDEHGFPRAVKTGKSQALFLKAEVHNWLRERAALRNTPVPAELPTVKVLTPPEGKVKRGPGRPRKTVLVQPSAKSKTITRSKPSVR